MASPHVAWGYWHDGSDSTATTASTGASPAIHSAWRCAGWSRRAMPCAGRIPRCEPTRWPFRTKIRRIRCSASSAQVGRQRRADGGQSQRAELHAITATESGQAATPANGRRCCARRTPHSADGTAPAMPFTSPGLSPTGRSTSTSRSGAS